MKQDPSATVRERFEQFAGILIGRTAGFSVAAVDDDRFVRFERKIEKRGEKFFLTFARFRRVIVVESDLADGKAARIVQKRAEILRAARVFPCGFLPTTLRIR